MQSIIDFIVRLINLTDSFINSGLLEKSFQVFSDVFKFDVIELNGLVNAIIEWVQSIIN